MAVILKSEWHQVEKRFSLEVDESVLSQIYPDKDEDEIAQLLKDIEENEASLETIFGEDAFGVVDWEHQYDDWWTDRKGGYEVTYGVE